MARPQHIHCTVNTCYYWETGNLCLAEEILVTSDRLATEYGESVDANQLQALAQQHGPTPTATCMETCCKTFIRKERGPGPVRKLSAAQLEA